MKSKKTPLDRKEYVIYKLAGALFFLTAFVYGAWYLTKEPLLPANLEVTIEKIVLENYGELPFKNAEIYLNHPLKGLRVIVDEVPAGERVTIKWEDFTQVYEGGEFDKNPVFMIWVLVDGYKAKKFEP